MNIYQWALLFLSVSMLFVLANNIDREGDGGVFFKLIALIALAVGGGIIIVLDAIWLRITGRYR